MESNGDNMTGDCLVGCLRFTGIVALNRTLAVNETGKEIFKA